MEKRGERLGYDISFYLPGDGNFFSASAAKPLGIETLGLKSHQFNVSIQLIANSRTTKISLLCQLVAIFTGIFGQNLQQLELLILQLLH